MRIISPDAFVTQPWQNGGGITHEIARRDDAGRLLWRLSIAEVASDGPFSTFAGLARVLTVIDGAGLHLHTPGGRIDALPLAPVAFAGDLPVDCARIGGDVRDFNLIFDPSRLAGTVSLIDTPQTCPPAAGRLWACLALDAALGVDGAAGQPVPHGGVAIFAGATLACGPDARALLVRLDPA